MQQWRKDKKGRFAGSVATSPRVPSASPSATTGVPPSTGANEPAAPRWPSRRDWEQAAQETDLTEDLLPIVKKTYNAIFIREWKRLSASDSPLPAEQRHREAEATARAAIRGATALPASEINAGMVVRSTHPRGYGEQTVAWVFAGRSGRYALAHPTGGWQYGPNINENHPEAQFIRTRVLRMRNGHSLDYTDDRNLVIRFPGLEQPRTPPF